MINLANAQSTKDLSQDGQGSNIHASEIQIEGFFSTQIQALFSPPQRFPKISLDLSEDSMILLEEIGLTTWDV